MKKKKQQVSAKLFGKRLKTAREEIGYSLQEAVQKSRVPEVVLSFIEEGDKDITLSFAELIRLAVLYKKPVEYFLLEDWPTERSVCIWCGRK